MNLHCRTHRHASFSPDLHCSKNFLLIINRGIALSPPQITCSNNKNLMMKDNFMNIEAVLTPFGVAMRCLLETLCVSLLSKAL
jgi:hypothetical protein